MLSKIAYKIEWTDVNNENIQGMEDDFLVTDDMLAGYNTETEADKGIALEYILWNDAVDSRNYIESRHEIEKFTLFDYKILTADDDADYDDEDAWTVWWDCNFNCYDDLVEYDGNIIWEKHYEEEERIW